MWREYICMYKAQSIPLLSPLHKTNVQQSRGRGQLALPYAWELIQGNRHAHN